MIALINLRNLFILEGYRKVRTRLCQRFWQLKMGFSPVGVSVIMVLVYERMCMAEQNGQEQSQKTFVVPLVVLAIVVAAAVVWRMTHAPAPQKVTNELAPEANTVPVQPAGPPPIIESKEIASQPIIKAEFTLDDVIRVRKYWDPAFQDWTGKQAPNFDLADMNGKDHKLSNYKGIKVMLIFWATWCGPCRQEMSGLIELRKSIPADKLAMLAISYEKGDTVRSFLAQNPVNYTVIATPQEIVPPPFSLVNGIPASFFIDKNGVIRLATEGLLLPKEIELILKALD
jgi:peroxiredoxin